METKSVWPAAIVAMVLLLLCTVFLVYKMPTIPDKITAEVDNTALVTSLNTLNGKIDTLDKKIVISTPAVVNESAVDKILEAVTSEDNWKKEAIVISTSEWEEKGDKAIFLFLDGIGGVCQIQDKEDIVSVKVTDDNVRRANVEDQDARVEQELTVRYECLTGAGIVMDKRAYLVVDTTIKDGDVDEQEITLA